jgi:hypothetical protein
VRAASAVSVTGEASAIGCSQLMLDTGTKTELAKTSGNSNTNPAVCAVSAPRTTRETKAKIQLRANPKAATLDLEDLAADAVLELVAGPFGDHAAVVDDGDLVRELIRFFEVLRRQQDRG